MWSLRTDTVSIKFRNNQRGFTFLEVLVAFSFTAIVLLGIYQVHSQTIIMETVNRFNSIAPILAEQKLSEMLSNDTELPMDDEGNFEAPYEGYRWQVRISEIESDYLGETANRFRKIMVHIKSNENQYDLETFHFFLAG